MVSRRILFEEQESDEDVERVDNCDENNRVDGHCGINVVLNFDVLVITLRELFDIYGVVLDVSN